MFALLPRELPEALIGRPEGVLLSARAIRAYRSGNYSEALRFARTALDVQRRAGAARDLCDTLGLCAYFSLEIGAYARTEEWGLEQLPLAERLGSVRDASYGQLMLGAVYLRQARFDQAEPLLEAARKGYEKIGSAAFQMESLAHLTAVHCACGELSRAHDTIDRASRLDMSDPATRAYLLSCSSTLARIEGRANDALAYAKSAREVAQEHGVQEFFGHVTVSYVESLLATGDHPAARRALDEAEQWLAARAAKIDDPALRSCFLDDVPEHRRIRELSESVQLVATASNC
jgi:tetratricopeptide (TPR) repeat protein